MRNLANVPIVGANYEVSNDFGIPNPTTGFACEIWVANYDNQTLVRVPSVLTYNNVTYSGLANSQLEGESADYIEVNDAWTAQPLHGVRTGWIPTNTVGLNVGYNNLCIRMVYYAVVPGGVVAGATNVNIVGSSVVVPVEQATSVDINVLQLATNTVPVKVILDGSGGVISEPPPINYYQKR